MPQIDGLRFVAIMAVIAYHISLVYMYRRGFTITDGVGAASWINKVFAAGNSGVALFFAISGFILSVPFARQGLCGGPTVSLREYYIRRVTRIEPPYVIQLLIMTALCIFLFRKLPSHPHLYHKPDWFGYMIAHISSSLIYGHSLIFGAHAYPNVVLWSLEVEVQFYVLAPFLARIFFIRNKTKRRGLFIGLFAVALLFFYFFGNHYRVWTSLAGNLQYFLIGFMLADFYVEGQLAKGSGEFKWDMAFVLAGALAIFANTETQVVLLPLAILMCFVAAFRGIFSVRVLRNPWITTIGGMCYTVYMYHSILISMAIRGTGKVRTFNFSLDLMIQFVLITTMIVLVCAFLFLFLERPFMDRNWPTKLAHVWRRVNLLRPNCLTNPDGQVDLNGIKPTGEVIEGGESATPSGPARPRD